MNREQPIQSPPDATAADQRDETQENTPPHGENIKEVTPDAAHRTY